MSLKARFFGGDADKLFRNAVSGGPHTTTPTDNQAITIWQDEDTPATKDFLWFHQGSILWRSPGAMLLPSVEFQYDGIGTLRNYAYTTDKALSDVISASACTVIMAIRPYATGTNESTPSYNTPLFSDEGGKFGIHQQLNTLYAHNYDGNSDATPAINISLNTDYIVMARHSGGTLYFSVLSGAGGATRSDQSVASGNTSNLTSKVYVGRGIVGASSYRFAGYIGEVAIFDSDEGATNSMLTDMVGRWLPAGVGTTRGTPFGTRSTAFNGGRCMQGNLR